MYLHTERCTLPFLTYQGAEADGSSGGLGFRVFKIVNYNTRVTLVSFHRIDRTLRLFDDRLHQSLHCCCAKCDSRPLHAGTGNCVPGICIMHPNSEVATREIAAVARIHINSCTLACALQFKLTRPLLEGNCAVAQLIALDVSLKRTNFAIPPFCRKQQLQRTLNRSFRRGQA
jgi:hypothetical protein